MERIIDMDDGDISGAFYLLLLFFGAKDQTQGCQLARQAFYH